MDLYFNPAPNSLPPNSYLEQPNFLYHGNIPASLELGRQVLAEVGVCEVLRRRHMHALGLIHNDINPSNIMIDGGVL